MTTRDRIIELVNQLNAVREQARQLEDELDRLLPGRPGGRRMKAKGPRAPRGAITRRIIQLMQSEPRRAFGVTEIAKRLKLSNLRSLRATVLRLASQRHIQRQRRGLYRATK